MMIVSKEAPVNMVKYVSAHDRGYEFQAIAIKKYGMFPYRLSISNELICNGYYLDRRL